MSRREGVLLLMIHFCSNTFLVSFFSFLPFAYCWYISLINILNKFSAINYNLISSLLPKTKKRGKILKYNKCNLNSRKYPVSFIYININSIISDRLLMRFIFTWIKVKKKWSNHPFMLVLLAFGHRSVSEINDDSFGWYYCWTMNIYRLSDGWLNLVYWNRKSPIQFLWLAWIVRLVVSRGDMLHI